MGDAVSLTDQGLLALQTSLQSIAEAALPA